MPLKVQDISSRLSTKRFGRGPTGIFYFPETISTNDEAIRRAQAGGQEGEVFIADHQTAGRGRMGRVWESPRGKNLYLSLLLRPPLGAQAATSLTLVAAAVVFEAVSPLLKNERKVPLAVKWPNDLYAGDRKIAGILTEMEATADRVQWVVVGIGIDVNAESSDFSTEVQKIASSLRMLTGNEVDRAELSASLILSFEKRYSEFCSRGPAATIDFVQRHSYLAGKRVRCEGIVGTACGLSPEGYLLVQTDAGKSMPILSGDITVENS